VAGVAATPWLAAWPLAHAWFEPEFARSRRETLLGAFAVGLGPVEVGLGAAASVPLVAAYLLGWLRLVPAMRPTLLLVVAAALAVPGGILTIDGLTLSHLHVRLPLLVLMVALASTEPPAGRRGWAALGAAALLALGHVVAFGAAQQRIDAIAGALRAASGVVPVGARVLPAVAPGTEAGVPAYFLTHLGSYLVIDRKAFVASQFGMYEVGVRPAYQAIFPGSGQVVDVGCLLAEADRAAAESARGPLTCPHWADPAAFDVVLVLGDAAATPGPPGTEPLAAGPGFALHRVIAARPLPPAP
jgi:hypothetical protein